jgi:hypothetical protein
MKLALHPQVDPVANPVPLLVVGQAKQEADEPLPIIIEVVLHPQFELRAFHFKLAETQLQV